MGGSRRAAQPECRGQRRFIHAYAHYSTASSNRSVISDNKENFWGGGLVSARVMAFCLQTDLCLPAKYCLSFDLSIYFILFFVFFTYFFLTFLIVCLFQRLIDLIILCVNAGFGLICGVCVVWFRLTGKRQACLFVFYWEKIMFHIH